MTEPMVTTRALIDPSRKCSLRCEFCVTGDTMILMPDMTRRPIAEIAVGDSVVGFRRGNMVSPESVIAIGSREAEVFKVTTAHGSILATSGHPWLTGDGEWVQTKDLSLVDSVQFLDGQTGEVHKSDVKAVDPDGIALVFNMQTTSGTYWANGHASHNCYYLPNSDLFSVQTWEQQKKQVEDAVARKCTAADLSGGEPLQQEFVVPLVQLCTDMGLPVRIISSLICPEKTLDGVLDAGVSDWLISTHGSKAETHDAIVHVPKARQLQIRRIAKISARGPWCVNYVLVAKNQTEMADWARWLVSLERPPHRANVINFNVFGQWTQSQEWIEKGKANVVDLRIAGPILDEALDILEEAGIATSCRYLPMCALAERHRKTICNDLQVAFDPFEWDTGFIRSAAERTLEVGERYARGINLRNELQTEPCASCGLKQICGGANRIWHQLALEKFGCETLVPQPAPDCIDTERPYWTYRKLNVLGLDPRRPVQPLVTQ